MANQHHMISIHGPLSISFYGASKICNTKQSHLIAVALLDIILLTLPMATVDIRFWHVPKTSLYLWLSTGDADIHNVWNENCRQIRYMMTIARIEVTDKISNQKLAIEDRDYKVIVDNFRLFCMHTQDVSNIIGYEKNCVLVTAKLFGGSDQDFAILIVPCTQIIHYSGFGCASDVEDVYTDHKWKAPDNTDETLLCETFKMRSSHMCTDKTYLLSHYVCDGYVDCAHDGSDEENCTNVCVIHVRHKHWTQQDCFKYCHPTNCSCLPLYYQCSSGGCIAMSRICDDTMDCTDNSDEGQSICTSPKLSLKKSLKSFDPEIGFCSLPQARDIRPVTLSAFCNDQRDCLHGEDEWTYNCSLITITNALRCGRPNKLVPVCSNSFVKQLHNIDCSALDSIAFSNVTSDVQREEDMYCTVKGLSYLCINISFSLYITYPITSLEIHNTVMTESKIIRTHPEYLVVIIIKESVIVDSTYFDFSKYELLGTLIIIKSALSTIKQSSFYNLKHLGHLCLKVNPFHALKDGTFISQQKLLHLDLSFTNLEILETDLLNPLMSLEHFDLSHSRIADINLFYSENLPLLKYLYLSNTAMNSLYNSVPLASTLHLTTLHVINFEICCIQPLAACSSDKAVHDIFFSCSDIIENNYHYLLTYFFLLSNVLLNGISLHFNCHNMKQSIQSLLVISLNISDMIMTVYLLLILVLNYIWRGFVAYVALIWKKTEICRISGIFMIISIMLSNIIVCLISLDRFICFIWNPFVRRVLTMKQVCIRLILCFVIGIALPISSLYSTDIKNTMCISLGNSLSMAFSIAYAVITTVLFISTAVLCFAISINLVASKTDIQKTGDDHRKEVTLRVFLIVLTNFTPSITLTILSLASLVPNSIPTTLEANLAFFIFPMNAISNPIIYTLTSSAFTSRVKNGGVSQILKLHRAFVKSKFVNSITSACWFNTPSAAVSFCTNTLNYAQFLKIQTKTRKYQ